MMERAPSPSPEEAAALEAERVAAEAEAARQQEEDEEEARWLADLNNEDSIGSRARIAEARAIYLQLQAGKAKVDQREAQEQAALNARREAQKLRDQATALLEQQADRVTGVGVGAGSGRAGMEQFDAYKKGGAKRGGTKMPPAAS
jgi:hypothetical protein